MFDTVRLFTFVEISVNRIGLITDIDKNTYYNEETGEIYTSYKIFNQKIPYIKYNSGNHKLEIELSIPKYLFKENITEINETDIELFFRKINKELHSLFSIDVDKKLWKIKRVDVSWNFNVGDKIHDYLNALGLIKLPWMKTVNYNQGESIEFNNQGRRILFYDKERECISKKCPEEVIQRAKGILRMEIRPSYHEMIEYSSERNAVNFLTVHFFKYLTSKILSHIKLPSYSGKLSFSKIASIPISRVEKIIGFNVLCTEFGLCGVERLYKKGSLNNRKQLLNYSLITKAEKLKPLEIDYSLVLKTKKTNYYVNREFLSEFFDIS